jgi:ArsR family metal-binding transcriptional regulator
LRREKQEDRMLLQDYTLRIVLADCNPSSEKVNALVELSQDISEVLPYLNTVLKGFQYSDKEKILTVKWREHLITFRPMQIAITKLEDEKEAKAVMKELEEIINDTHQNREKIKPDYSTAKELKSSDVLKLLPGTNCKECGERTCFSFSFKLIRHELEISKCKPLLSREYQVKREGLSELLLEAGYNVAIKED